MTRTDRHVQITREAARRVARVRDDPSGRLALADDAYINASDGRLAPYAKAELAFIGWEIRRGVLDPIARIAGRRGGSRWWRTVNERLLRDAEEASLLYCEGLFDGGSNRAVDRWIDFFTAPSAQSWYRAHNASIVSGYIEGSPLAMRETENEQRLMNIILTRALYAYGLSAGKSNLGWMGLLRVLGRFVATPTGPIIVAAIDLPDFYPRNYPMTQDEEDELLGRGFTLPGLLGRLANLIIFQDIAGVYEWNSKQMEIPQLLELINGNEPCYPGGVTSIVEAASRDASFVRNLDDYFEAIARRVLPDAVEGVLLGPDGDHGTTSGLVDLVRWRIGVSLQNVCFVSWEIPVDVIRPKIPAELEIDEFDGKTYVTAVALRTFVHLKGLEVLEAANGFEELNFRAYVRHKGRPGIYFISVDAEPGKAVEWIADNFFRLPYSPAAMNLHTGVDGRNVFTSERLDSSARFRVTYDVDPDGEQSDLEPGTLRQFICKRDFAFSQLAGRVLRFVVRHPEWKMKRVLSANVAADGLFEAAGLPAPIDEPFVYYSQRSDGVMYPPVPW